MAEGDAARRAGPRHGAGRQRVDGAGRRLLALGEVDGGKGGGVDDGVGRVGVDRRRAGFGVRQIGALAAQTDRVGHVAGELGGELSRAADDEEPHAAPSRWPTPARACSGRHQASLSRYQRTVRSSPSSSDRVGRQPSSAPMRDASMA